MYSDKLTSEVVNVTVRNVNRIREFIRISPRYVHSSCGCITVDLCNFTSPVMRFMMKNKPTPPHLASTRYTVGTRNLNLHMLIQLS